MLAAVGKQQQSVGADSASGPVALLACVLRCACLFCPSLGALHILSA
jgi:hypothetical protein